MALPESPPSISTRRLDPVLRNALRYTVSAKEYQIVHRYLVSRSHSATQDRVPSPGRYPAARGPNDDFNTAAVRASFRVFLASQIGLSLWDQIRTRLIGKGRSARSKLETKFFRSPNFRLSLSLSVLLLLHRLLHRFFTLLRQNLLHSSASTFRNRNPRIANSLTSRLAPAIGASLAGFALGLYPADQLRLTATIYVTSRAAEFGYTYLEREGWFNGLKRRGWVGSWMLMPLATGQLLHSFVFDRDCFPEQYGNFILKHSPAYIQHRPASYPRHLSWPNTSTIVDALAEMARLNWPPFTSPILYPALPSTLPPTLSNNSRLSSISALTAPASPLLSSLSCALLHPSNPSCFSTYLSFHTQAFPSLFRFFFLIFAAMALPFRAKAFWEGPTSQIVSIVKKALRMAFFVSSAVGTSWASICLFAGYLPRSMMPKLRFFWGGFLGGLFAFVFHGHAEARDTVMASVRLSIDSLWKVGIKKRWWKGVKGGDVILFAAGLAVINAIYDRDEEAMDKMVRRGIRFLRGEEEKPREGKEGIDDQKKL